MTSWLWLLVPGTPIAAALLILRWPALHRRVWAAPLPAVLVGLAAPDTLILPGLWPGAHWGLADPLAQVLLLFFCALWGLAGLFAVHSQKNDPHRSRFWVFWLLSLAGNLMLVLAQDAASFYVGFTLMSLMAFGLVVHNGTPEARRAGRLYLQLAILGELILFAGLMLRVHETGGSLMLADWHSTPVGLTTLLCLILGFGLKAGFWPLHIWLPIAHPAAPPAASAVLSGAMIKAGILGLWRFLPGPDSAGATPLLQNASAWLFGLGMFSAWYGIAVGLLQHRDKTALAYSSVSQVGYLLMIVALYLAENASAESLAVLLGFYMVHHGFAKGALFLGAGMAHEIRLRQRHWVLMALPALALAAYPLTTGAVAKTLLKDTLYTSPFAHWETVLSWGSAATLLLVVRALWLMYRSQPAKQATDRQNALPRTWLLSWGTLCLATPFLPWLWPAMREALLSHLTSHDLWTLTKPTLVAVAILIPAVWFNLHPARLPLSRFQPAIRTSLYLRRHFQVRPLHWRKPAFGTPQERHRASGRQLERYWNGLAGDPTGTTVWLLATVLVLISLMAVPAQAMSPPEHGAGQPDRIALDEDRLHFRHQSAGLGPQQALARFEDGRGTLSGSDGLNFGLTKDTIWVALPLDAIDDSTGRWLLEVGHASLDEVTLYYRTAAGTADNGVWQSMHSGDRMAFGLRPMPHRHHVFDLPADAEPPLLLRVRSQGTLTVPLTLWRPDALWQQDQNHYMVLGVYYGILLSLLIYNLFLYIALRDTLYITYSGYVFFLAIGQAGLSGVAAQFLFPHWGWLAHLTPTAGVAAAGIFGTLFVQKFLGSTPYRLRLGWLMPALSSAYAITLITVLSGAYNLAAIAVNLISLFFVISAASLGIASMVQREPGARFFVLAWLFFLGGVLVIALHNLGVLPTSFLVSNAMMIGSAVEMLLLSLALGDRIQNLQQQKDQAQREAIAGRQQLLDNERIHKEALESRVRERTRELEETNRLLEASQTQLEYQASHDPLTGLANRQSFKKRAEEALVRTRRHDARLALAVIDLDSFKPVNDTYGHAMGDRVLTELAHRLQASTRQTDTLARFGGDEFVVMLEASPSADDIDQLRQKFSDCTARPVTLDNQHSITVSLSIGFAVFPDDGDTIDTLFVHADNAMYGDKTQKQWTPALGEH